MLEEPLCDDEYEYYTDEDEADIEDEASDEDAEDDCWYLLAQDEDDTLKSSNSVPDVPGPVRKDSAWRRKFDEAAIDTLLTKTINNDGINTPINYLTLGQIFTAVLRSLIPQTRVGSRQPLMQS